MPTTTTPVKAPINMLDITTDSRIASPVVSSSRIMVSYGKGSQVRTTNTNPNYQNQINRGQDASTFYYREFHDLVPGWYQAETYQKQPSYTIRGFRKEKGPLGVFPTSFDVNSSSLSAQAAVIMRRKLRQFTGSTNAITPTVELRDLRKTISSAVNLTTSAMKTLIDIKRTKGKSAVKYASDAWLTYSFGISPTLATIDDISESISKYLSREDVTTKDFAYASETWKSRTYNQGTGPFGAFVQSTGDFIFTRSCKITAGFKVNLRSSNNYGLGKHLGLELGSLIPTAWELVPFSWVVDYFSNVGEYLDDTFAVDFGPQSVYIVENMKLICIGSIRHTVVPSSSSTRIISCVQSPTEFRYTAFQRKPLTALPKAPLRLKTTDEIGHHAITKLLNLASILGGKTK